MSEVDGMPVIRHEPPTPACRCYGCGADDPMGCGALCADCSWEDHLAHIGHTGEAYDPPHEATPPCCLAVRHAR